ncbi:MAG TPA: M4 family metallopeptidase [Kofleriaceae bacterium]|nr:M4 family metallopeptidase [Kofleriaceae bacterium]
MAATSGAAVGCSTDDPMDSGGPVAEGSIAAVEAVRIVDKDPTRIAGEVSQAALDYVRNYDAELGLSDLDDYAVLRVREAQGAARMRHVRLQHIHQGLPVWGSDVVVHSANDYFLGIEGGVVKNLGQLDVAPALDSQDALALGKADYATRDKRGSQLAYSREQAELVVFPGESGHPRVAWHVVFFTELQAGIQPGLWNYFVDAKTGDLLFRFNAIHTLSQASGPGGNPKVTRSWVNQLDVEPSGTQFQMNTTRLRTTNMNHGTTGTGTTVVGPLANIGDAPINDAHGFAEATLGMMQDWYGHNSINDAGFKLISRVHYSNNYENAFWDGTQMTYGDGASTFYPLSGDPDVGGHEIGHGFTTFHSNLVYSGQSGGNNESFSDIAGTLTEFFVEGEGADFDIGRDIFKGNSALRFMCDPPADGASIDNAADFTPGLDVHFSSGVMNKAFCLASGGVNAPLANVRRMGAAWYEANDNHWTTGSGFTSACQGVLAAATSLGFTPAEIAAISSAWTAVGVTCDGTTPPVQCDQTFTTASGTVTSPNFPNNYPNNFSRTYCIQPAGGASTTLTFSAFNTEANFDFVTIKNAAGTQLSRTSGTTLPPAATSTLIAITFTSDQSVVRSGWSASWGGGGGGGWSGSATPNLPTVDNGSACTNLTVSGTGNASEARLNIAGTHAYRSILRGTLAHNGVTVTAFPTGTFPNNSGAFSFTNRAVPGLSGSAAGTWTLCMIDTDAFGDTGVLNTWSVHN